MHMFKRQSKPRVLVLADQRNWAYDFDAKSLKKWLSSRYDIAIRYASQAPDLSRERFDLLYVLFYGDEHHRKFGIDPKKIVKQVSSHRWAYDDKRGRLSPQEMADKFLDDCRAVTTSSRRLLSMFDSIRPDVYHCPHGVELDEFRCGGRREGPLRIGWVGHPGDFLKGLREILLPATAGRFDFRYTDGTWSYRRVRRFYAEIDVLAISSIAEGDPRPLMEGMLRGCFPVCTDVGIVPELVNFGSNGLVVQRSVEHFHEAFTWCEQNLDHVRRVGAYNSRTCAALRSAEAVAGRTGDVFDVALGIRAGVPPEQSVVRSIDDLATTPVTEEMVDRMRNGVAPLQVTEAQSYLETARTLEAQLLPILPLERDSAILDVSPRGDHVVRFLLENGYSNVGAVGNSEEFAPGLGKVSARGLRLVARADATELLGHAPDRFDVLILRGAVGDATEEEVVQLVGPAYCALRDNGRIILLPHKIENQKVIASARPLPADEASGRLAARLEGAGLRRVGKPAPQSHWRSRARNRVRGPLPSSETPESAIRCWQKKVPARRVEVSIGIFSGPSPLELRDAENARNPVLRASDVTDAPAALVADPFMIQSGDIWYMFFEVFNEAKRKGEIGLASSKDGFAWRYERIVLSEPFHLSYPYVFTSGDRFYMIPEAGEAATVRLYEARNFPEAWFYRGTLLAGVRCVDSSVVEFGGRWWLFTETSGGKHDTLRLYHADNLLGPWNEHPRSPLVAGDARIARPAGRVIVTDGRIFRYTQDCAHRYGDRVWAFEITRLTSDAYAETRVDGDPVICGRGHGWNSRGMHHVDPHSVGTKGWIACVDGFSERPNPDVTPLRRLPA